MVWPDGFEQHGRALECHDLHLRGELLQLYNRKQTSMFKQVFGVVLCVSLLNRKQVKRRKTKIKGEKKHGQNLFLTVDL
jgi:hypothetical protein